MAANPPATPGIMKPHFILIVFLLFCEASEDNVFTTKYANDFAYKYQYQSKTLVGDVVAAEATTTVSISVIIHFSVLCVCVCVCIVHIFVFVQIMYFTIFIYDVTKVNRLMIVICHS